MHPLERYRGAMLGLAVGDALGTTLEFKQPGSFPRHEDMTGGGPFDLQPGEWTDDTSMALCLAESLDETGGFDPVDQLTRYRRWFREGHLSSTGACFDIGNTVIAALRRFDETGEGYCGAVDAYTAGNGSLMRLAPVPLAFAKDPRVAIERCADSSRTTHAAPTAIDACRYYGGLIVGALMGVSKEQLLAPRYAPVPRLWDNAPLTTEIDEVAAGSFIQREPPEIKGVGFVVKALEAALWAFHRSDNYRDGVLLAVNLGDDADTTGAIYGQLAGAYYGESGIPTLWRERLAKRELIESFGERLHTMA
jgi:ADP-ribosyl-[dinitrogen reductase] hydrolase